MYVRAEERGRVVYSSLRRSLRAVDADSNEDDGGDQPIDRRSKVEDEPSPLSLRQPHFLRVWPIAIDGRRSGSYLAIFSGRPYLTLHMGPRVDPPPPFSVLRERPLPLRQHPQVNKCGFSSSWAKPLLFPVLFCVTVGVFAFCRRWGKLSAPDPVGFPLPSSRTG